MTEITVASSIRFIIKEYLSNLDFDLAELSYNNNNFNLNFILLFFGYGRYRVKKDTGQETNFSAFYSIG